MIRLKDIAAQAGVSVMTVSKAMRDEPDVSAETKNRIRALARQMGYVPNAMAQNLRSRNTKLLGLLVPSTVDPIFARIMLAIEENSREMGYDLLLAL
ncbi:MAG TPA: LacI family DNA-binding transcriptional regulator, partial [Verrucomicrobiae bacterium]|nr:LacI family DNA-binding transcriptional regulator [Verrucomicrobiae bacterium]